jgi:RNA polymerase sigma-70 factor, ECF subfamily
MDDFEIVERCRRGDLDSFEVLFLKYEKKIYNLCYYTLQNKEDALDASQETCLKIYKSIDKYKGESKLSTWIYRVAYNTCLDYLKRRKQEISYDETILISDKSDDKAEQVFESRELRHDIKMCILRLSEEFRTIVLLRDINGLSYQEIAEVLCVQVGTVKSRLNRAREALRTELIKNGIMGR